MRVRSTRPARTSAGTFDSTKRGDRFSCPPTFLPVPMRLSPGITRTSTIDSSEKPDRLNARDTCVDASTPELVLRWVPVLPTPLISVVLGRRLVQLEPPIARVFLD